MVLILNCRNQAFALIENCWWEGDLFTNVKGQGWPYRQSGRRRPHGEILAELAAYREAVAGRENELLLT